MIQTGAYRSQEQAKKAQQRLADAGYSAVVREVDTANGKVYRVRTGTFPSRDEAQKALDRIKAQGMDGAVVLGK